MQVQSHKELPPQTAFAPDLEHAAHLDAPRRKLFALVARHGWNATAFQTLGPGYSYFFHGDGCVAYVDTGSAWVVAGAPIVASTDLAATTTAFMDHARAANRRCCFFGTEERFVRATLGVTSSLRIGEQPVWDPRRWAHILSCTASLRQQIQRAKNKAVSVFHLNASEAEANGFAAATQQLFQAWLATRKMPAMAFLVQPPSRALPHQHLFVAEQAGELVGAAFVIPVPQREGWFIEHLIRAPSAPNGTTEMLVDAVMNWACENHCQWLTLGLAPLAGDVPLALRIARRRGSSLFNFEGLRQFKAKLQPTQWQQIYLSRPKQQSAAATVVDVLAAFTHEGFLRFAARAAKRGSIT